MTYDDKPRVKSYDENVNLRIEIPDITLVDRFDQILKRFPERPAIQFLGRSLDYRTLMGHANGVAHALMAAGCSPGDVVGVPNSKRPGSADLELEKVLDNLLPMLE